MGSSDTLRRALRVPPYAPEYPTAVAEVAKAVWASGGMSYEVDRFVTPFLTGVHATSDADTLYTLGLIYERGEVRESAAAAFRAALGVAPNHRDAAERLARLDDLEPARPPSLEEFPSLPELPDLQHLSSGFDTPLDDSARREVSSRSAELGMVALDVGDIVAGRYRILAPLGAGGYAVVFRALDLELEDELALKLFRPSTADERELARFKQELRLARRLAHPNVVANYDFDTWNGLAFISMEFLRGEDLGKVLDARRLRLHEALRLLRQAFLGLGAAHDMGIVHRDVKPSNLFVCRGGSRLKIMDFGLATAHDLGRGLTRPGRIVGTPAYLAPERIEEDAEGTASVDLYAMGVVLYEAVVGRLPFRRGRLEGLFHQILSEVPIPPRERVPNLPARIDELILALLEKNPRNRPRSCAAVLEVIDGVLPG